METWLFLLYSVLFRLFPHERRFGDGEIFWVRCNVHIWTAVFQTDIAWTRGNERLGATIGFNSGHSTFFWPFSVLTYLLTRVKQQDFYCMNLAQTEDSIVVDVWRVLSTSILKRFPSVVA